MVKKKQRPLTAAKKVEIAERLHISIVEKIVHAKVWVCENLVFHGGTSLHLAWKSPRFSEDLDFIINKDRGQDIQKIVHSITKDLNREWHLKDGGSISFKEKKGPENKMMVYHFVYSHPELRGNVKVKAEFLQIHKELVNNYDSEIQELYSDSTDVIVRPVASIATLHSFYTDKVTAIVNRPYEKIRDFFDLWWLTRAIEDFDERSLLDSLENNFRIYEVNPEDFISRMENWLTTFESPEKQAKLTQDLEKDLKNWLPKTYYAHIKAGDLFSQMVETAIEKIEEARRLLEDNLSSSLRM